MKNSRSAIFKRHQKILQVLNSKKEVHVDELSKELKISPTTIRRDLEHFENRGLVSRFYGGARILEGVIKEENLLEDRLPTSIVQKRAIAKAAADFVEDGDIIYMNTSSTVLLMLEYLKDKSITVVTNNANIIDVDIPINIDVVLTGGELHHLKKSMVGDYALRTLMRITANKTFIGVGGVSAESGITTAALQETSVNELMLKKCTGQRFILAAPHKIGRVHNFVSGSINDIDHIITSSGGNPVELEKLRKSDIKITEVKL